MLLPDDVLFIMDRLKKAGHTAYAVGGCVRDSLLGLSPKDFDITTSAKPEEMQEIFSDQRVAETGIAHGTLTVLVNHTPYEVTTYRVDGAYTDHRHPDHVEFVDNLHADLARRDFTINAMAYNPETGIIDDFGGREDLAAGLIRCVGNPEERFREDALRILRGLRFASRLTFRIEDSTSAAIHSLAPSLVLVAPERIRIEFGKLLTAPGAVETLRSCSDVIFTFLPQLQPMLGFEQHNPHHAYDVWEHTLRTVGCMPQDETLRLAALLHDCGKPSCFSMENGTGHFYGHAKASAEIAGQVLRSLKVDNATFDKVMMLVANHDLPVSPDEKTIRRRLNLLGEDMLRCLLLLQHGDRMATGTVSSDESESILRETQSALDNVLAKKPCFSMKDLAINGKDLLALGVPPGRQIGSCLNTLLQQVIDGDTENAKSILIEKAKEYFKAQCLTN